MRGAIQHVVLFRFPWELTRDEEEEEVLGPCSEPSVRRKRAIELGWPQSPRSTGHVSFSSRREKGEGIEEECA